MSDLTFSSNSYSFYVSETQCNPLSKMLPVTPANSTWNYYYYTCSDDNVNVAVSNPKGLPLNICIFAQGGRGGYQGKISGTPPSGYSVVVGKGGGGGGGQVLNIKTTDNPSTNFTLSNFSIILQELESLSSCQLIPINGGTLYPNTIYIKPGQQGFNGDEVQFNSNGYERGGDGGDGGDGGGGSGSEPIVSGGQWVGGAGGNGGAAGSVKDNHGNQISFGVYSGDGGAGFNPNVVGYYANQTPRSAPVTFADGTSANIAQAGIQQESGNVYSGFLIYYEVSQV